MRLLSSLIILVPLSLLFYLLPNSVHVLGTRMASPFSSGYQVDEPFEYLVPITQQTELEGSILFADVYERLTLEMNLIMCTGRYLACSCEPVNCIEWLHPIAPDI